MKDKNTQSKEIKLTVPLNRRLLKYALILAAFVALLYVLITTPEKVISAVGSILSIFAPFIVGGCIAYVVNLLLIPMEKLWMWLFRKSKGNFASNIRRPICLALSLIIVLGIIFAIVFMIIPAIGDTVVSFIDRIPQYVSTFEKWYTQLTEFLERFNFELPAIDLDANKIGVMLTDLASNYGNSVLNKTVSFTTSIASFFVNIILGIVFSIYLLSRKEQLGGQANKVVRALFSEKAAERIVNITALTNRVFTKFVTGQLTEAVIIGILCFIGMMIFGMPYAGIISVLVGFTALIPIFGAFFGTAVGAFLILLENPVKAFWFVVFIIVLQQLEGNLIYPRVVGKSVGLPGMWVLVAVTVGGGAFGILGMLFSVPVCSVLYVLFKQFVEKRLEIKNNSDKTELSIEAEKT